MGLLGDIYEQNIYQKNRKLLHSQTTQNEPPGN